MLDESALTGESNPVRLGPGEPLRGGGTNAGAPFELRVTAPAAESTYAGIIRLVRAAEESKAPFERLADRFALGFLALTLVLAAFAWIAGGNVLRALSVLVVATPCPLILAAPAAINRRCVSGREGGAEVPERMEGTVEFCGPSATAGYYRNPGATAEGRLDRDAALEPQKAFNASQTIEPEVAV